MILVTGATGELGKETIQSLLRMVPAGEIIALARDTDKAAAYKEKGIEVRQGDYTDYDSLVKAFDGVEKLLMVSALAFSEVTQHENVIRAAREAGVKYIVYTGIQTKKDSKWVVPGVTEREPVTEQYLKASGLDYTVVKNTLYADVLPFLLRSDVLEQGVFFSSGDGRVAFATRSDLGEALAVLLVKGGYENQVITLSNNVSWSAEDIASILSGIAGKPVPFHNAVREDYVAHIEQGGVPSFYANFAGDWADATKALEFEEADPTLATLLGRDPVSLAAYLKATFKPVAN